MIEHSGAIQDAAEGGYLAQAVLDPAALDSVRDTNVGFLALIAQSAANAPAAPAFGLDVAVVTRIAALDAVGRRGAADYPYTLFSLRFDDASFWRGVAREPASESTVDAGGEIAFVRKAIFLAWHLARNCDLAAAIALGLGEPARQAWRALPLSALDRAATAALPHLAARWGDHRRFWPRLVEAAAPVDRLRAASVRLLGLQLLAAEGLRAEPPGAGARPAW